MWKSINIAKIIRTAVLLLPLVLMLSGCGGDNLQGDNPDSASSLTEQHASCWQDKILTLLYDTMGSLSMSTYSKLTGGAMNLMMVAFAIWFAFRLLKFVSSVAEENSAQVWNEVLKQFLMCLICGLLAGSTDGLLWVLNMIVFPIYNAFLELGGAILSQSSQDADYSSNGFINFFSQRIEVGQGIICAPSGLEPADLSGFPRAPRDMMNCMICAVNERLSFGNFLAFQVIRLDGFMATVIGLILLACFTIVKLGFVFYLVDTIFRFTMMVVLLPVFILAYAFPQTKSWTKNGLVTILNSAAFMMCIAILIAMALMAIVQVINANSLMFNEPDEEKWTSFNAAIFSLLMIAFLVVGTMGVAQQLSSALVGGGGDAKFQKKLKSVALTVAGWLTGGTSHLLMKIGTVKRMSEKYKNVKNKLGRANAALNKYRGK